MKDILFVLASGFTYSNNYFDEIIKFLPEKSYVFYEGQTINQSNKVTIGIGHSLGFLKLNNSKIKFDYLIGLGGFINFCGDDSRLHNIRKKFLIDMIKKLQLNPQDTILGFQQQCGFCPYSSENKKYEEMLNEINLFFDKHTLINNSKILIIGALDDKIVPKIIIEENFNKFSNVCIKFINGLHCIGIQNAKQVADLIFKFTNDIEQ